MNTYCDQFCKNSYCFGTSWDVRCARTDLIENDEYQDQNDNRTCVTHKYENNCLQYQFAKSVAEEIQAKIDEGDEDFLRFLEKVNNRPRRHLGVKVHPVTDFLQILL